MHAVISEFVHHQSFCPTVYISLIHCDDGKGNEAIHAWYAADVAAAAGVEENRG